MESGGLSDQLALVDLFSGLDRKTLDSLVQRGTTMTFPAGRIVAEQDRDGSTFHLVLTGSATVSVSGEDVTTLSPGGYFGEMSLLDGAPRSATVIAGPEGLKTFTVSQLRFSELLDEDPQVTRKLCVSLVARIRTIEAERAE